MYLAPQQQDIHTRLSYSAPSSPIALNFFDSPDDGIHDPEIRTMCPPTPVKSRMQHAELPALMQQASVESKSALESRAPPSRHPQPLPPLMIPPTPIPSVSAPTNRTVKPARRTSSIQPQQQQQQQQQQQCQAATPVSLTPGSIYNGSSPFSTPSPRTPMGLSLPTPTASVSSPQKKNKEAAGTEIEALVHQGIRFHEAGQLEKATEIFRQAAMRDNPIAMFLYGVSLRHGWGCKRNEHLAFQYLQKAAEHAVLDLNSLSSTVNTSVSKGELIMAIYELGVSFRHGWGCKKNKSTAVYFFKIAADLGDPDAQNDLGHCYYHGHGTKKDLYMAAKYYRMADKQGHGIMGNSWIYKSKYDKPK
ncbi:hypothetical protein DFQ28_004434 [Apophysomyces sp. BC1034]|nr:hypothetical protein DFQ30_001115 [Apophysomyces sp. BC1015]KAG0180734.1 hypothetical protein DFQ29_010239 [Apophysomyces sp. BC1021]KAG0188735.1 hypothetical protein DFQ28_004434 [Apophysomyces sp. BC1034]